MEITKEVGEHGYGSNGTLFNSGTGAGDDSRGLGGDGLKIESTEPLPKMEGFAFSGSSAEMRNLAIIANSMVSCECGVVINKNKLCQPHNLKSFSSFGSAYHCPVCNRGLFEKGSE